MLHVTEKDYVSPSEALDIISWHNKQFGVFLDKEIILSELADAKREFHILNPGLVDLGDVVSKKQFLVNMLGIDESLFKDKHGKTTYASKHIDNIMLHPSLTQTQRSGMHLYSSLTKKLYRIHKWEKFLKDYDEYGEVDKHLHRMIRVEPELSFTNTNRICTSNPNVQNLPREKNYLAVPRGYTLVVVDSSQIEPRINFSKYLPDRLIKYLINLYGDAYYGILHYIELSEDELVRLMKHQGSYEGMVQKIDMDEEKRSVIKTLILATLYGMKTTANEGNKELFNAMEQRIENHAIRKKLIKGIKEWAAVTDDYTLKSAFGTPIVPDVGRASVDKGYLERCAINNPIQGTASDLMNISVQKVHDLLRGASGKSYICMYVYDSFKLYLHDDDLHLLDEISQYISYQVEMDGEMWIPIPAKVELVL